MPFASPEVAVRQSSDQNWELLEPVVYEGRLDTITVPTGFRTDFASVPKSFTWLIPRYGRYTRAAILHDWLCMRAAQGKFDRADADGIFRRTMRELGVGFLRRWLMWIAVRFGAGWRSFWKPGFTRGLWVLALGLLASVFLVVPIVAVALWSLAFWILEWLLFPGLKVATRSGKEVNRPTLRSP